MSICCTTESKTAADFGPPTDERSYITGWKESV